METSSERYPIVTVDAVLLTLEEHQVKILLHRRSNAPFEGAWALPGGYLHLDEDADTSEAIARVLHDKTGLDDIYLEQLKTFSGPARDPRGWSVSVSHLALIPRSDLPDDLGADVGLFDVRKLPKTPFDHGDQIREAVSRLRGKGAYSSLPVQFLPAQFTMVDLQQVYEDVLGETGDQSSFRRKISSLDIIEETGDLAREGRRRPAALYRLKAPGRTFDQSLKGAPRGKT